MHVTAAHSGPALPNRDRQELQSNAKKGTGEGKRGERDESTAAESFVGT